MPPGLHNTLHLCLSFLLAFQNSKASLMPGQSRIVQVAALNFPKLGTLKTALSHWLGGAVHSSKCWIISTWFRLELTLGTLWRYCHCLVPGCLQIKHLRVSDSVSSSMKLRIWTLLGFCPELNMLHHRSRTCQGTLGHGIKNKIIKQSNGKLLRINYVIDSLNIGWPDVPF